MNSERKNSVGGQNNAELTFLEKVSRRLPEDVEILQALADLYAHNDQFDKALVSDLRLSQLLPQENMVWYNLGCSYALNGMVDIAFDALNRAVELGYTDYEWMKSDSDLGGLREDPRFEALLSWLYNFCYDEGN